MDKYEYKLKTEQMLELMEEGAYRKAAVIADEIDWKRVRNASMLTNVSDIYEKNKEYDKSYSILNLAYRRAEGSRKIVSRLCTLALKTGNVDEAIDYYDDFVQLAPKDPNQYILRYQILRAQRAPIEQQIEALEEYKKSEYIEEWAYELAKLYQEAGMTAECLEECDDLILWFSEGQYVYKAMELKMQYKPLTPSQQEKYDRRYEKLSSETEEMPDVVSYAEARNESEGIKDDNEPEAESVSETGQNEDSAESPDKEASPVQENEVSSTEKEDKEKPAELPETGTASVVKPEAKRKKLGDTMPLGEALRRLLRPDSETEKKEPAFTAAGDAVEHVSGEVIEEEPELEDLEKEIDEIESVADIEMVSRIAEEKKSASPSGEMKEIVPDDMELSETAEILLGEAEEVDIDLEEAEPIEAEEEIVLEEAEPEEVEEENDLEEAEPEEAEGEIVLVEAEPEEAGEEIALEEAEPTAAEEEIALEEAEPIEAEEEIDLEEAEPDAPGDDKTVTDQQKNIVDKQITGQMSLEDILADWEGGTEENSSKAEELLEESFGEDLAADEAESTEEDYITEGEVTGESMDEKNTSEPILPPDIQRLIDEIEGVIPREDEEKPERHEPVKKEEEPRENMGKVADSLRIDNEEALGEDFDEDEYFDVESDFEEAVGSEAESYSEEEEPADSEEYFEEEEELADGEEYFEEEEEPADGEEYFEEEEEPADSGEYFEEEEEPADGEEYFEEEEELADGEEYFEEEEELADGEEYFEEEEELADGEEYFEEEEELADGEEYFEEEEEPTDGEEYFEEEEELEDGEEYFEEDPEDVFDESVSDIDEEFRVNPEHADREDEREVPDDDDDGMDILSATTPLSRKETAKMIATGKTAPLPLDEISDALSMSDTGFIVHGRYDLETQSGIGTRAGLTEEQKKLFSYFVPVRGMSEQLVDVLEQDKNCTNRNGTSKAGNLLIIGNKGNGKTVLAVDVVKAIQKQRDIRQGKVAIVTGDSLNKKKIGDIIDKLYGGALIIEKAGKMNEKTVARLNKAMEQDTGEMLIVLEEQRKPLDRLLSSNREFRRKFTSRLEIPLFINDELVTFGQTYAQENGYRIDEMGILALYSKIDSLQREDHAVTVAEVKEIMDEAIQHSQKASAKKLMKRVFGKNTDEADRIILSEKDFNI